MSYTKFSKAVTKWLKANGLPCYGTAYDSPEETKARLDAWMHGSKEILRQWITDKRYRELISCAHGGWYQDDVIFEPLAEHFVANHLFDELRFLCERGIRFSAEDMLATIKSEKEEHGALDIETIRSIDVPSYVSGRSYSHLGEIAKLQETGAGSDDPLCRLSGADPRTCGIFGRGKVPAREHFGSDNHNKRFETISLSAVKGIT